MMGGVTSVGARNVRKKVAMIRRSTINVAGRRAAGGIRSVAPKVRLPV